MNFSLLILLFIQVLMLVKAETLNDTETITTTTENSVNKTSVASLSCVTADGDAGVCRETENCVINGDRRERLINCGSVIRGTLSHICCPNNQTLNSSIESYTNDANCGRHFEFWNIVGGGTVKPHFLPWTVAIYQVVRFPVTSSSNFSSQHFYRFVCGGTLISNRHVLSAAHCVVQGWRTLHAEDFLVKVGAHNIDSSGTFHKVEHAFAHENYRSYQRYNDISIFTLTNPVRNEYSSAACLPDSGNVDSLLTEGVSLTVAGWGTTRFMGPLSKILKEATVKYINNEDCSKNYTSLEGSSIAYPSGIDSSMICAGFRSGGADSCQGDSGGPLLLNTSSGQSYLVGIVSFGYQCSQPGYPGIYTRVSTYMNWIIQAMKRY